MKVTLAPVRGTRYTIHDGAQVDGKPTARCRARNAAISPRRLRWHILEASASTNCARCLKLRKTKPYVYNRTLAEESEIATVEDGDDLDDFRYDGGEED